MLVHRVLKAHRVLLELKVFKEILVRRVLLEHKEQRVLEEFREK